MRLLLVMGASLAVLCAVQASGTSSSAWPSALAESTALGTLAPGSVPWSGDGAQFTRAVLDSFPAPGVAAMGVDWVDSDEVLYHVDEALGEVYSITPEGEATYLFRRGAQIGYPLAVDIGNGICYVETGMGEYLYITDYGGHTADRTDRVYKFELDGTFVQSWDVGAVAKQVVGICYDGQSFWLSSSDSARVVRCDSLFQRTAWFDHPALGAGGLDYDADNDVYYVSEYLVGDVYVCDSQMNVLGFFPGHPTASRMVGLAVGRTARGRSLWMSSFGLAQPPADATIYEVDDSYYNETPVERTTWGSIKAMYR